MPRPAVLGDLIAYMPTQSMPVVHMFSVFALVAVFLAGSGIFAVISQSVALRTTELSVRMALGATRTQVIGVVLRRGWRLTALGVALGLAGSVLAAPLTSGLLLGGSALDPRAFLFAAAALTLTATVAAFVPARRASAVDPVHVLR